MRRSRSTSPIGMILFGLAFMAGGVLAVFVFGWIGELSCSRPEPMTVDCVRSSKLFGMLLPREEQLPGLRSAYLSESCDEDGCSYRVDMVTAEGTVPLVNYYTGGIGAHTNQLDKVNQINIFLNDREQSELILAASTGDKVLSALPLLFLVIGGAALLAGLRRLVVG